mmetsp:Transcript_87197/g.195340  ORF Transcript_87197/g.195340 Transcript_87197/m.195340 type:complete len:205 (+) Transcript_87197:618-1232(+)
MSVNSEVLKYRCISCKGKSFGSSPKGDSISEAVKFTDQSAKTERNDVTPAHTGLFKRTATKMGVMAQCTKSMMVVSCTKGNGNKNSVIFLTLLMFTTPRPNSWKTRDVIGGALVTTASLIPAMMCRCVHCSTISTRSFAPLRHSWNSWSRESPSITSKSDTFICEICSKATQYSKLISRTSFSWNSLTWGRISGLDVQKARVLL